MDIVELEDLQDEYYKDLYYFIKLETNITNRLISNNLLWNIVYLRKAFLKSETFYKRSSRYKSKYSYVIINKDKSNKNDIIQGIVIITLQTKVPINCYSLLFIVNANVIKNMEYKIVEKGKENENILYKIISKFNNNENVDDKNYILNIYIDSDLKELNKAISNNNFTLGYIDSETYTNNNNIYYKIQLNNNNGFNGKTTITKSSIIKLLLSIYELEPSSTLHISTQNSKKTAISISPILQLAKHSGKLTQKHKGIVSGNSNKIINKYIYEVEEIQNRPEYNYNFTRMHCIKSTEIFVLGFHNNNLKELVMNRYFKKQNIYNQEIFDIYLNIFKFMKDKYNKNIFINNNLFEPLLENLKKYNISSYILRFFKTSLTTELLYKFNNKLVITNSDLEIENLSNLKCDFIYTKQLIAKKDFVKELKHISNNKLQNILFSYKNSDLNNAIDKYIEQDKKYNCIYINNTYINYDFIISSIHLIIKFPYIFNVILNSLKVLNKNGILFITLFIGNKIEIPSLKKIFGYVIDLFEQWEILDYSMQHFIIIKLSNFYGLSNTKLNKVNNLIKNIDEYEKDEFDLDDVAKCLLSNKYYYKYESEITDYDKKIKKKIIYDLPNLTITYNYKITDFINKYNDINNNYLNFYTKIYNKLVLVENNKKIYEIKLNKYFIYNLTILFYYMIKHNIIDNPEIVFYIQTIIKKYKNIDNYINSIVL